MVSTLVSLAILLGVFYLVILPILVFRLMGRVGALEREKEEGVPARRPVQKTEDRQVEPLRATAPVASIAPKAATKAASPSQKGKSFEEQVGGRVFQWVGIGALVIALLFFMKWSFESGLIGPTGRTMLGYIFSGAAIIAGDRLRQKYGIWSLAFTGGGALGSFVVTSIALHTYRLFPEPIAIVIYILTTFVVCLLSGYYGSIPLAVFGIAGGFLTPVLVGGGGNTLGLLSYVLILDVGILALGHVRQWRWLNAFGLIGTGIYEVYALFDMQFDRSYAFMFIAAFFVIYVLVPYIYNLLKQQKSEPPDLVILLGNALLHFGLILGWLERTPGLRDNYDALVSLGFAVVFLVFATEVYRRNKNDTPLVLGSLALTVLFATLMIPLQLGGAWVPLAWSVEGAFLLWVAMTLKDIRIQRFAWVVMAAAYVWYFFVPQDVMTADGFMHLSTVYQISGLYLFLGWTALFVGFAFVGLTRDDHREQHVVPFILVGIIALVLAFMLNLFMEYESSLTWIQRLIQAAALIGGSYIVLIQASQQWSRLSPDERRAFGFLGVGVQIVTLTYLTTELVHAVDANLLFTGFDHPYQILNVGISILWAVYGAVALIIGVVKQWKPLRLFSLVLLLIAMAKLTLVDFFGLGTGPRVIGFTVLGGLLVAASFLYQSNKATMKSLFFSSSDK
ncbi:MAG: DUF2339 domain-containing protein [Candidatus Peribacteraceae bacterium]|nr:DUF2339 domain-containing protein [Candidatus Peribacteraceae bacterium]